jgi:hypothetical protein
MSKSSQARKVGLTPEQMQEALEISMNAPKNGGNEPIQFSDKAIATMKSKPVSDGQVKRLDGAKKRLTNAGERFPSKAPKNSWEATQLITKLEERIYNLALSEEQIALLMSRPYSLPRNIAECMSNGQMDEHIKSVKARLSTESQYIRDTSPAPVDQDEDIDLTP